MKYYYQDAQGLPQGPVTGEQLFGLSTNGTISGGTLIAPVGTSEWVSYSSKFQNQTQERPTMTQAIQVTGGNQGGQSRFREYKVVFVAEGGCGTILLGASGLPIQKLEATINEHAAQGWQVVFQVIENKRFLLFWTREAMVITFGR